jgi:hypothetical protein
MPTSVWLLRGCRGRLVYRLLPGFHSSGVGLDTQKKAVTDYLNGGNWKLVDEFTEVETGE